jgi:Fatty acid hydroxylase superfamily
LQAAWDHFHERCFGIPFEEFDSENDERVVKFRRCPEVPQELRVLASNAFNNLRHVLDQAINCAALELGAPKRNNYFPFAKDKADLERVIKANCPTVPATLLPTIRQFMPHGDGDAELYALSKLFGPNKHQVVLNIDSPMNGMLLDTGPNGWFGFFRGPEVLTAFYRHPVEVLCGALLGSVLVFAVLGLSVEAGAVYSLLTAWVQIFIHANVRTPRWLGWWVQRPEMHRLHHQRDHHRDNYADLPLWDWLFGTLHNPRGDIAACGFAPNNEARLSDMLQGKDVHRDGQDHAGRP